MNLENAKSNILVWEQIIDNHEIIVNGSKDEDSRDLYIKLLEEVLTLNNYIKAYENGDYSEDALSALNSRCEIAHLALKDSERSFIKMCAENLGKTKDKIWTK